jgi:murein DD-endopeptidase MepM/ murein hydrolase activator NlpD
MEARGEPVDETSTKPGPEGGADERGPETDDDLLESLDVLPDVPDPEGRIPRLAPCVTPVPVGGRLTSGFGKRGSGWHGGQDIAPPAPGQQGVAVHAIAAGRAVAVREKALKGHTGLGVLIRHPGDLYSYYGHLAAARCREGQEVDAGEVIGVMGWSGRTSPPGPGGTHLHLGIIVGGRLTDPKAFMAAHGVPLGRPTTPGVTTTEAKKSPPSPPPPSPPSHKHAADPKVIRQRLAAAGYAGTEGAGLVGAIRSYQKANGLVVDGDWGPITEKHYQFTRTLQTRLNLWKAVQPKLRVDGDLGPLTRRALRQMQGRNGLSVTGTPDPATRRRLGI